MARRRARAEDLERLARPEGVRALVEDVPGFDRRGFLAAFIECFGGVERFARSVYVEYEAAPAGSMAKQRYSSMICTLISQESASSAPRAAAELDDEELRATLLSIAAEATRVGVPHDGPDAA